jgi:N-acetylglucosamine-6-phosphate deacetylase
MSAIKILTAARIFTGKEWLTDCSVIIKDGLISEIVPSSALSSSQAVEIFDDAIIAPAFIDLQIYGANNKLLAVVPEAASVKELVNHCRQGGTAFCLPAIATNSKEVIFKSIDAVRAYWKEGGKGVLGIHLEGPWINPVKRGAHVEALIHSPSVTEVKEIIDYGKGIIKMITLAPECCNSEVIDLILSYDIVISAGHSNATLEQAKLGFASGITAVTHLYNAMSPLLHRQPGLVGAAMDDDKVMASIIPDGYHIDYAAIRIAKKVMGERLFAITDAVTSTRTGYYKHRLADEKYEADGILSGSALTMQKAVQNLVLHCGIDWGEALRMCSLYPARVLRIDNHFGKIEKDFNADLVILDNSFQLKKLITA